MLGLIILFMSLHFHIEKFHIYLFTCTCCLLRSLNHELISTVVLWQHLISCIQFVLKFLFHMSISQFLKRCLVECVPFKLLRIFHWLLLFKSFLRFNIFGVYVAMLLHFGIWISNSLSLIAVERVIRIYAMSLRANFERFIEILILRVDSQRTRIASLFWCGVLGYFNVMFSDPCSNRLFHAKDSLLVFNNLQIQFDLSFAWVFFCYGFINIFIWNILWLSFADFYYR